MNCYTICLQFLLQNIENEWKKLDGKLRDWFFVYYIITAHLCRCTVILCVAFKTQSSQRKGNNYFLDTLKCQGMNEFPLFTASISRVCKMCMPIDMRVRCACIMQFLDAFICDDKVVSTYAYLSCNGQFAFIMK